MALHPPPRPFRIWGAPHRIRPPNLLFRSESTLARDVAKLYQQRKQAYDKLKALRRRKRNPSFRHEFPEVERSSAGTRRARAIIQRHAMMNRWNGRRTMFLSNYKFRRDAAFSGQENAGIPVASIKHPIIDGLFRTKTSGMSLSRCVHESRYTQRRFGVGKKFGMDFDLSGLTLFVTAAKRDLEGVTLDLEKRSPKVKYNKPRSTNWPNEARTRLLSKQFHATIRDVLKGDLPVVRATYEHLIDNYLTRPYMPGLLRLLTRSLAKRDEWKLLKYLLSRAIYERVVFLGNRNVSAIINYAMSLSIRFGKGKEEVTSIYRSGRRERRDDWQLTTRRRKEEYKSEIYSKAPRLREDAATRPEEPSPDGKSVLSKSPARPKQRILRNQPYGGIYFRLADARIKFQLANGHLKDALKTVENLATSFFVPRSKTINAILREMIRVYRSNSSSTTLLPREPLPSAPVPIHARGYHTIVAVSDVPTIIESASLPWTSRTLYWFSNQSNRYDDTEKSKDLEFIVNHLNRNNIGPNTVRLLAQLATSEAQLEIPWEVAQRARYPKIIIRQTQEALVEAGCKTGLATVNSRHIRLSRALIMIIRLEGKGIVPTRKSIYIALLSCLKDGNITGARALLDRLDHYGHSLLPEEIAHLVKELPQMGMGTLSTAAGEVLSSLYVRTEQLAFLVDLGKRITDHSYTGPYVQALGRCGSATEIWRVWDSISNEKLKDGVITAFVDGFVSAKDLSSAMEFVRVAAGEGYPLNFLRARAIAGGVERGQWHVVLELLREMLFQRTIFKDEELQQILSTIASQVRKHRELSTGDRSVFLIEFGKQLGREISSLKDGRDLDTALERLEEILERYHA